MKPEEVLKYCNDKGIQFVDLKFNDLPGLWQHFSITLAELSDEFWKSGIGFDGSSIAASRLSTRATCCSCPTPRRPS